MLGDGTPSERKKNSNRKDVGNVDPLVREAMSSEAKANKARGDEAVSLAKSSNREAFRKAREAGGPLGPGIVTGWDPTGGGRRRRKTRRDQRKQDGDQRKQRKQRKEEQIAINNYQVYV